MEANTIVDVVERRRHKRFFVKNRLFAVICAKALQLDEIQNMSKGDIALAVIRSKPPKMGEIIELSKGGLTFSYVGNDKELSKFNQMDILFVDENFHLSRLPFITLKDTDLESEAPFNALSMKRLTVKFGGLTRRQKRLLDHALKNFTTEEVPRKSPIRGKQVWSSSQ